MDILMEPIKSLDEFKIIAALLHDVHTLFGDVFNTSSLRKTTKKVERRVLTEGKGFLTKTLPRIGKALDKALALEAPLTAASLGLKPKKGSKLPKLFGELFSVVLDDNGFPLKEPNIPVIQSLRDITYCFYKYELKYTPEQELAIVEKFERTEDDLGSVEATIREVSHRASEKMVSPDLYATDRFNAFSGAKTVDTVAREAKRLLQSVFSLFDPAAIHPSHGPGAVATRQQLWEKYEWRNVSRRITERYPLDAYFYASLGHFCDTLQELSALDDKDSPARVILVPKDSRGPRLISCEPVDFQWVQQGLGRAIRTHVQAHRLTRGKVNFTRQDINRNLALAGSKDGQYATLDLNEASDRVSLALVRLLYPDWLLPYLEACRTLETELPNGKILKLKKFAPMGSNLCFPILALTVWAILAAAAPDYDTRRSIYVYGDDVIVPTAYAEHAMKHLESFGLKINRDKSCTKGFFRESCGMDAYKGVCVTPVRIRTLWSTSRSPEAYASWIAYANSYYDRRYFHVYDYIVERLHAVYGAIPDDDMNINKSYPSLRSVALEKRPKRRRNAALQRVEHYVYTLRSPRLHHGMTGWRMLLRFFTERTQDLPHPYNVSELAEMRQADDVEEPEQSDSWHSQVGQYIESPDWKVRSYTRRKTSMLVKRWR